MYHSIPIIGCMIALLSSCAPEIDTGRNGDPSHWQGNQSSKDEHGSPKDNTGGNSPSSTTGTTSGPNSNGGNSTPSPKLRGAACFEATSTLPPEMAKVCQEKIKTDERFKEIYPFLCEKGNLLAVVKKPECGWDGNLARQSTYMFTYSVEKDTSKDYQDVNASITFANVPIEKYIYPVRLAYEDYDKFKSEGYQWISGTRENKKISAPGTSWEQGLQYRFRADKGEYELGYDGIIEFIQLTPDLAIHLNRATGNFARIAEFAQVVLYSRISNNATLALRIEQRRITSKGLYELAKRSASEMAKDTMQKGYRNATK